MRRYATLLILMLVALVSCRPAEQAEEEPAEPAPAATEPMDAIAAAPDHYTVEFENEQVRVLRITYAAGDQTPMHSHPDGVLVFLEDGSAEMTLPDGTTRESPGQAGEVLWAPAETHSPKALTDISVLLVELKGGAAEAAQANDPTVVAPDHYAVALENEHVRVLRITYAAGEQTPMHGHPDGVAVFLEDGTTEMTLEDETTQELSAQAGDALWTPAGAHSPKALTDISVIQVELKGSGG